MLAAAFGGHIESEPLVFPKDAKGLENAKEMYPAEAYIDGEAEKLAGFDIPFFIDGDLRQLDSPSADILLLLPSGEYKCTVRKGEDGMRLIQLI